MSMSVFILTDPTATYWWLRQGGFSPVSYGKQPLAFADRSQAMEYAALLQQRLHVKAQPLRLSLPGERKR